MRRKFQVCVIAFLLAPAILSQDVPLFHDTANLVTVPCVVTDGRGQTINNLTIDDFRLFVDGAPTQIDSLWPEGDLPLLLGVIEDVSQSQQNRIAENDRAANQLFKQVVHKQNRAFLVTVDGDVTLKAEVTEGPYGLRNKLLPPGGEPLGVPCGALTGTHGRKRPACGGTALWNAVYAAAHYKLNGPGDNKALLILSDGNDTGSTHTFSNALEEVQRSGAVVYVIQYPDDLTSWDPPSSDLSRLARETGGLFFNLRGTDYSAMISRIAADIRGRYVLGFRPGADGGDMRRRSLKVQVMRPGANVRARQEYSGP